MNVRDAAKSAERWVRAAQQKTQDFLEGVAAPRRPWKESTLAAAAAHTAGTQAALSAGRFAKGVTRTAATKWAEKTTSKGGARYAAGVADGQADYSTGIEPYLATLRGVTLPPRGAKGAPANLERVRAVVVALRAKKESM